MDRRQFLGTSVICAASLSVGNVIPAEAKSKTVKGTTRLKSEGSVSEPARTTPVVDGADVVVVGGGPAGFASAVAAAREGCDVLLLERGYFLGGLFTGCDVTLLNNMFTPTRSGKKQAVFGICDELCRRLDEHNMITWLSVAPNVDTEATKYLMEEMCAEAGVRILYGVQAAQVAMKDKDTIDAVILETKSGRVAVKAEFVIDCTGDGDILDWTGEDFKEYKYDISSMWRVGGMGNAIKSWRTPNPGVYTQHLGPGIKEVDGLDMYVLTDAQLELRKRIWKNVMKYRQNPASPDAFLLSSPSVVGVRITRVLNSMFNVTTGGAAKGDVYDDVIGIAGSDSNLTWDGKKIDRHDRMMWQVPYRSIVPKKIKNLLVAGRCFGFEEGLMYDAREVGTCLLTGQAAGTAATIAIKDRCSCREVEITALQSKLRKQNVKLEW